MTTKDYQKKHPLLIFLSFFKRHKGLFALDMPEAPGVESKRRLYYHKGPVDNAKT